ncbi:MAG TPA: phage tail tape measure protein [Jatrophihabitans sp.]|nr:phage tail tape measure protein [Jatrophihabitans sp.]
MALSIGELVGYLRIDRGTSERDLTSAQRSLDLTATSARRLGESVGQGEARLQRAGTAADSLASRSGKLRAAQLSALAAQERYNAVLADGEASTARLASAEATLIRARERVASLKPPAPPDPTMWQRAMSTATGAVATAAKFGVALGAFDLAMKGIEYAKSGAQLTVALNGVQAASHATDEEMTKVRETAVGLGKDLTVPKATAVDAAQAIDDLVKAGVSLDRAMVAARPALLLASAAQVQTADSARVLGDTLDDFHLKADQAGHVANVLAAAANSAGGGLMDLFDGLKYAGPTARTVGLDVTYTAAALVELAKSGMQGTLGGTALMNMLTRLNPTTKSAKAALHDLGVEAYDSQGKFVGLPKVIDQLHAAQQRLNPQQFGQAVQIAFGNRAKNAVINFATGGSEAFDEFYKKMQAGNVQEYADKMNRGLSAGGALLRKEVTSWAIDIEGKAEPALAAAVFWIGEKLPAALSTAQHTLQPLEHEIGDVLVPTVHGAVDVVRLLVSGLGEAGHLMDGQRSIVTGLGTAVLGMWAAYKGYQIAKTAVSAVGSALDTVRLKAMYARDSVSTIGTAESTISSGTIALGALGLALGVAAYAWQKHAASVAADRQQVQDFTTAIQQDSGALGENTKAAVFNALQKQGAVAAAKQFGISLSDLTDASLGNADALAKVNAVLDQWKRASIDSGAAADNVTSGADDGADAYYKLRDAIGGTNSKIKEAVTGYQDSKAALGQNATVTSEAAQANKDLAASMVYTVDASGNLVQGQQQVGSTVNDTTEAMVQQKTAAELLKDALDTLNGVNLSVETTTNAFLDSLDQISSTVDANAKSFGDSGKAMSQNTAEGRRNREQLVNIIQAAKDQAQATADSVAAQEGMTAGLQAGNAQLKANEDRIRAAARAAGLSNEAVDALIKSIGQLATVKAAPEVSITDSATAKIRSIKAQLKELSGAVVYTEVVTSTTAGATLHGQQAGERTQRKATGGIIDGPGTGQSDSVVIRASKGEFMSTEASASRNRGALEAGNRGAQLVALPGYAGGGLVPGGKNGRVSLGHLPAASGGSGGSSAGSAVAKALDSLRFSVTESDLPRLVTAISGTAATINSAMTKLVSDVHNAAVKGLGNGALVTVLSGENRQLQHLANERAGIVAKLKVAGQALASERAAETAEAAKVSDKITSEFDIATAGVNSNGFTAASTPESIIADLTKQRDQSRKFAAGLLALQAKGLNKDLEQQLGEDGVATAGANVAALQGATKAQIKIINGLYASTRSAADAAGGAVSRAMYQSGIDTMAGYIKGLTSQDAAIKKAASHVAGLVVVQVKKDLGINSPSKVTFGLGANGSGSFALGLMSNVGKVKTAASTVASTASAHLAGVNSSVAVRLPSKPASVMDNRPAEKARVDNHFYITQLPNEDGAQLATRVGLFVTARSA